MVEILFGYQNEQYLLMTEQLSPWGEFCGANKFA